MTRRRKPHKQSLSTVATGSIIVSIFFFSAFASSSNNESAWLLMAAVLIMLLAIATLTTTFVWRSEYQKQKSFQALESVSVDLMTGKQFERYVGELLKSQGYRIQYTPATTDYGVDILGRKSGSKVAIQVKRYNKPVGQPAIREAIAGKTHYRCNSSMVITNTSYTKSARNLAESNGCILVDGVELGTWVRLYHRV